MKKIAIYAQAYTITTENEIIELIQELNKHKVEILFEEQFYKLLTQKVTLKTTYKTFSKFEELSKSYKAMFTIGGDGTFLRAVTYVRNLNIPIIGINTGRLGFLATVCRNDISSAVDMFFRGDYKTQKRTLLQIETAPKSKASEDLNFALNEVTISRKQTTAMIGIKTHINGEYLTNYWADGLIISTPTGSTGYSLSCNGPVILPNCNTFILNPIAPHNLNARPILINDNMCIELEVDSRKQEYLISLDSRISSVKKETKIKIQKANFTINTVLFENQSFLKTLRGKLLWGGDMRNE